MELICISFDYFFIGKYIDGRIYNLMFCSFFVTKYAQPTSGSLKINSICCL